jgi:hypothetical protein
MTYGRHILAKLEKLPPRVAARVHGGGVNGPRQQRDRGGMMRLTR